MNRFLMTIFVFVLCSTWAFSQSSMLFYNGEVSEDAYTWTWEFTEEPTSRADYGYTPGTAALKWSTYTGGGYQGIFLGYNSSVDMSSVWSTDSVYFKLRAPSGLDEGDANLEVVLYDSRSADWAHCVYYTLTNFHDLNDGNWHQFSIAISDFINHPDVGDEPIDPTDMNAVSFEYFDTGVATEFYIDKVWIGQPDVPVNWVIFNGQTVSPNVGSYAWGFDGTDYIKIAEGEGYNEGTSAILWEHSDWEWQGIEFWCETAGDYPLQDFSTSWDKDSLRLKIKAPEGINNFSLKFLDWNEYTATKVLDDVAWDGEWQVLNIALEDFTMDEGFDISMVYWLKIEAAEQGVTIPERVLITDIWTGNPSVNLDFVSPPAPSSIIADNSTPYFNFIAPEDITSESGERYSVYYSLNPITDLNDENVILLDDEVSEGGLATHHLFSPLNDGDVSYYYAATCTDAANNISETFFALESPIANTGKGRTVINFGAPENFVADGFFDEWSEITPFVIKPTGSNIETGSITDSLDYSAKCYLAMDSENLYVAFDVIDDNFTWQESNTHDWWDDESIEFFIGLYDIIGSVSHHNYWGRGAEADYRIVFRPDQYTYDAWPSEGSVPVSDENYHFESGGPADYFIEAKIPFASLAALANDSVFTPLKGMKVPLEIQINDVDEIDGGNPDRMHFGDNSLQSPWNNNPDVWTFTWIGIPGTVDAIESDMDLVVNDYYLKNNYPNPFNPSTTIEYAVATAGNVKVEVFNALGQNVKTLINKNQLAGKYQINFDASHFTSGIYYYKITANDFTQTKKMLLIK